MVLLKHKFIHIPLEIQNIGIQLRLLVCNSTAYTDILLGHDAMLALGMWQDYPQEKLYIKQTAIPFRAKKQNFNSTRQEKNTWQHICHTL